MIDEKTLQWKYYVKKLPLYLQNSYGFKEHFRMLYEIMLDTNKTATDLLNALNLTRDNYYDSITLDVTKGGYEYDLLDKMASLYGVNRYLDVDYINLEGEEIHKALKLNNNELLKLILVKVVQNSYIGTYENIRKLYNLIELPIYIYNSQEESGNVYVVFDSDDTNITDNLKALFYADLLSIKSMGIKYNYRTITQTGIAEWDSNLDSQKWDVGVWS